MPVGRGSGGQGGRKDKHTKTDGEWTDLRRGGFQAPREKEPSIPVRSNRHTKKAQKTT